MKSTQLQIRISASDKIRLQHAARAAGCGVSEWVLHRALQGLDERRRLEGIAADLKKSGLDSYALAELNDLLSNTPTSSLKPALQEELDLGASPLVRNYAAAMIEHHASQRSISVPDWIVEIPALKSPWFASELRSLRLHLLSNAPVAFRRRNLFIDATVGARV